MRRILLFFLLLFIVFCFFKPRVFDSFGLASINNFFNISRSLITVVLAFMYFFDKQYKSKIINRFILFFGVCFLCSYLNNAPQLFGLVILSGSALGFAMLTSIMNKKDPIVFINSILTVFLLLIVGNLVYMIYFFGFVIDVEEIYGFEFVEENNVCLLSNSNMSASFFIPAMLIAIYNMFLTSKFNLMSWTVLIASYLSGIMLWSATSLVAETVLLGYAISLLLGIEKLFAIFIKPRTLTIIAVLVSLGITFFKIQYLFAFIIEDLLHKDLSMTGRTDVWNLGFKSFAESPLIGVGYDRLKTIDNCYVQVLGNYGLIGGLCFALLFINSVKGFIKKDTLRLSYPFGITASLLILMFVAESWVHFWGLYVLLVLFENTEFYSRLITSNNKSIYE